MTTLETVETTTPTILTCGCNTKSGTACKRLAIYKYIYVRTNEENTIMYSCGIQCHREQVMKQLSLEAFECLKYLVIRKRKKSNFELVVRSADIVKHISGFDNIFHKPFTKEYTIWRDYNKLKLEFKTAHHTMNTLYNVDRIYSSNARRVDLIASINAIMEPYIESDDTGTFPSEYALQDRVNDLFAELRDLNEYLREYWRFFNQDFKPLKHKYKNMKTLYKKEFFSIQLPWQDSMHNECSICLSEVCHHKGGHLSCGHSFHNECIRKWADQKKSTCPMCRVSFEISSILKNNWLHE